MIKPSPAGKVDFHRSRSEHIIAIAIIGEKTDEERNKHSIYCFFLYCLFFSSSVARKLATPSPLGKANIALNYNLAVKRYFLSVGEGLAPPATNK